MASITSYPGRRHRRPLGRAVCTGAGDGRSVTVNVTAACGGRVIGRRGAIAGRERPPGQPRRRRHAVVVPWMAGQISRYGVAVGADDLLVPV